MLEGAWITYFNTTKNVYALHTDTQLTHTHFTYSACTIHAHTQNCNLFLHSPSVQFILQGSIFCEVSKYFTLLIKLMPFGLEGITVVQFLGRVQFFATPWTAAHQASLSFTISQSLRKLMSIESVMPSNHLVLCHPVLLLPSIFPSIRVFSNDLALTLQTLPTESSTVRNKRFYCARWNSSKISKPLSLLTLCHSILTFIVGSSEPQC